jgi:hypothetical protein
MESAICDSVLSQLSVSTTSAHSANAQPFQKRKSPPILWRKKKDFVQKKLLVDFGGWIAILRSFFLPLKRVFFSSVVLAHR